VEEILILNLYLPSHSGTTLTPSEDGIINASSVDKTPNSDTGFDGVNHYT
jgi:hypothetical protein